MVFMQHGLMVGMWMGMTTMIGVWLWRSKTVQKIWDIPMYLLMPAMFLTVYLCKSKYAVLLLATGMGALFMAKWLRTKVLLVCLLTVPLTYATLRASGAITGESMIAMAEQIFGEERASSLATRLNNENLLAQRANERPVWGWGGWGNARVQDERGRDLITDSLWIITLGKYGWVGLGALTAMLLLPMLLVCFDWRADLWSHPMVGPVVVLGMMVALYMFDHLMNGMVNPIFMLACGAVGSAHFAVPLAARYPAPAPQRVQPAPHRGFAAPQPRGFRPA
jgi:hypothetical protein